MPKVYAKYDNKIYENECNINSKKLEIIIADYDSSPIVSAKSTKLEKINVISLELVEVIALPNIYFIATNYLEDDFFDLMKHARNNHALNENNFIKAEISRKHNEYMIKIKAKRPHAVFEKTYTHTFLVREPFQYQNESVITMYEVYRDIKHLFSGEYTESVLNKILHVFWAFVDEGKDYKRIVFSDSISLYPPSLRRGFPKPILLIIFNIPVLFPILKNVL